MLIGYERVSTDDQNLALQHDALQTAGCEKFFSDKMSGAKADRPSLREALEFARKVDTSVVWRLDRLGRSLKDLIALVEKLENRKIEFRSLQESMGTTTRGKGSEAASKCHATAENYAMQGFQRSLSNLTETFRKMAIYGQVVTQKWCGRLILS